MKKIYLKIFLLIIMLFFLGASMNVSANSSYEVPILVYHSFGFVKKNTKETAMQTHYRVNPDVFEKQMQYLLDNNYHPITLNTFVDSFKNNIKLPLKAVVLSFDDGWKTQYKYAVPILKKYNFPATFFIVSDYANSKSKSYMNWNELKDLVANNFEIASHTKTHAMLTKISSKILIKELTESKKILEDMLGLKITTLAYPYYNQNEVVRDAVKSAGYSGARAGSRKSKNSLDRIYELKTQEVVNNPNPFSNKRLADF